ncbi:hypothetical protein OH492_22420 [Vibrio chagasii]|nr:hypothetical protein [Vibrio chagasii]
MIVLQQQSLIVAPAVSLNLATSEHSQNQSRDQLLVTLLQCTSSCCDFGSAARALLDILELDAEAYVPKGLQRPFLLGPLFYQQF